MTGSLRNSCDFLHDFQIFKPKPLEIYSFLVSELFLMAWISKFFEIKPDQNKDFYLWGSWGDDWMHICEVDRLTKTFFWNFQSIWADLCYILIYKQMSEKVFCSNIAPSLSSGNHQFYKAEYMGQSCPNQVWAITFDWSALATWKKTLLNCILIPHLSTFHVTLHRAPCTWKFRCQVPAPGAWYITLTRKHN